MNRSSLPILIVSVVLLGAGSMAVAAPPATLKAVRELTILSQQGANDPRRARIIVLAWTVAETGTKQSAAAQKELDQLLAQRDITLFELMSELDPRVRRGALLGAKKAALKDFGPAARAAVVQATPYLGEIARDSGSPLLQEQAIKRLHEVQARGEFCKLAGLGNPRMRDWALQILDELVHDNLDELSETEVHDLDRAVPGLVSMARTDPEGGNGYTGRKWLVRLLKDRRSAATAGLRDAAGSSNREGAAVILDMLALARPDDPAFYEAFFAAVGRADPRAVDLAWMKLTEAKRVAGLTDAVFTKAMKSSNRAVRDGAKVVLRRLTGDSDQRIAEASEQFREGKDPLKRREMAVELTRQPPPSFARLVELALVGERDDRERSMEQLTLAAEAPLPRDVAEAMKERSDSYGLQRLIGLTSRSDAMATGEAFRELLGDQSVPEVRWWLARGALEGRGDRGSAPLGPEMRKRLLQLFQTHGRDAKVQGAFPPTIAWQVPSSLKPAAPESSGWMGTLLLAATIGLGAWAALIITGFRIAPVKRSEPSKEDRAADDEWERVTKALW